MGKMRSASQQVAAQDSSHNGVKRRYVSQSDVPSFTLDEALKIPKAIVDEYAGAPTRPLDVAKVLHLQPASPNFRMRCGAAIGYGLTDGGSSSAKISVLPLARRILTPTQEDDDLAAKREAFLKPRVFGLFLTKYDGSKLPREDIAVNVLQEMGVPKESAKHTYEMIAEGAKSLGLLDEIKDVLYVNLKSVPRTTQAPPSSPPDAIQPTEQMPAEVVQPSAAKVPSSEKAEKPMPTGTPARQDFRKKRVFITHGKEKGIIDPIKKLLGFGELEPVVAVERQTVSVPVSEKVMNDMRSCGAAIIHVDAEQKLIDANANEHDVLNSNVLIEIGASMALYGKRFILLVREGVRLPSNLQGLYEVRYTGETMDGNATIRLLEAINDIKNHPLPE